jgi:cytoskeleton protein RodZ
MADSEQPAAPAAPAAQPPPAKATLGETLRVARLAQDLTVEQLATELRIEAKQLTALENNRFEQIGVPVFVKGYLKQYGLRLGLDPKDLLALYYEQTTLGDVQIQPSRTIKLRDESQITSWIVALIVLAIVAGLAVWWWNGGSFGIASSTPSAPAPAPPATTERAAPVPPAAAPATPVRETLPAVDPPAAPAVEPSEPAPAAAAAADTAPFVAPDEGGSDEESPDPSAGSVPLSFAFERESWAEVTDARGERLLFGLSEAGRNVTVRGAPPFSIVLGDANAVRLTVDGAAYEIPRSGRQGNLARFTVASTEE